MTPTCRRPPPVTTVTFCISGHGAAPSLARMQFLHVVTLGST